MTTSDNAIALATQTSPQAVVHRTGRAARIGFWALALGFGGLLLWAAFAPLDEGVPAQGMVALDTKRKTIQHLTGGIIKEVLVREGDHVKEGQTLMRLDEAVARANFAAARQRYIGLLAMQNRLSAEQRGLTRITFDPVVMQQAKDPQISQTVTTQQQLFDSRRSALQADVQSMNESIQGQQALIQAYQGMLANRKSQLASLTEELDNLRGLVKDGYAPRNKQLELERMLADVRSSMAELQGNTLRAQRAVAEYQQRIIQRQQEYRKDVDSQLADVSREVPADAEKFRATQEDLDRIDIKSPVTGQVMDLAYQTIGGVVGPGQKLMEIVPEDQALLIEVRVPPHLIDRVHKDLPVDVRFSSFAHSPQLVVQGKVMSVSEDLVIDPRSGAGYYLARVGVTADGYESLGKRQLQPGMPVEVVFKTGERSALKYLLSPLVMRLAASMKEE